MRAKGLIISSFVAGTLLIAGAWSFYTVFIKAPTELARATAQGIQEFFNFRTHRSWKSPRCPVN